MPEIDTNVSELWWLKPRPDSGSNPLAAIHLGAQLAQQQRDYVLRLAQFGTQQKEAGIRMQGELQRNKLQSDELDDIAAIDAWNTARKSGQEVELPAVKTSRGIYTLNGIMANDADLKADQEMTRRYGEIVTKFPTAKYELARFKKGSPDWAHALEAWGNYHDQTVAREKQAAERLKQEGRKDLITLKHDYDMELQLEKENLALEVQTLRNQGTKETAEARARISGTSAEKWMDHAKWTSYKARLDAVMVDMKSNNKVTPKLAHEQMDAIDSEYGVTRSMTTNPPVSTPAPVSKPTPANQPSTNAPPTTFRWNEEKGDFE